MRILLFTLALLFTTTAHSQPATTLKDRITQYTLENGLEIVVIQDHRAPIVTHMLWYKAGAADEPRGKSGIAHFLEHLLFKGTKTREPGEFSRIISINGGSENAFTSWDYTGYYQRVAVNLLPLMMELESDRMQGLILTEEDVLTERDVILEERNSRVENKPSALFGEHMARLRYPNHPYGIPIIGWWHEMEALSQQDALEFYRANYAPNNAILVVAGDVQPDEVLAMAKTHYGGLKRADTPPRTRVTEPPARAPIRTVFTDARVSQPYIIRTYPAPSRQSGQQRAAAALQMFSYIFGGTGITSFMGQEMQLAQKISINQSSSYDARALDNSDFSLYAVPAQGVSLQDLETALDATIAAFLEQGVDDAHLARIKTQIEAEQIYALDNQSRLARQFGASLSSGLSVADVLEWPELLQSITAEEVMEAARGVLNNKSTVTGWLMGEEEEETISETISKTITGEGDS